MKNDNKNTIHRDDPRLTAYALGEGTGAERAEIEAVLAADASLAEEVESIRHTAQLLTTTLAAEPLPEDTTPVQVQPLKKWHQRTLPRLAFATTATVVCCCLLLSLTITGSKFGRETAYFWNTEDVQYSPPTSAKPEESRGELRYSSGHAAECLPQAGEAPVELSMGSLPADPSKSRADRIRRQKKIVDQLANTKDSGTINGRQSITYPNMGLSGSYNEAMRRCGRDSDVHEYQTFGRVLNGKTEPNYSVGKPVWETRTETRFMYDGLSATPGYFDPREIRTSEMQLCMKREYNTEAYDAIVENEFRRVTDEPLSTFSIDVDTAGYSNVRRYLTDGAMPPAGAVRIEEMVNYFDYNYMQPKADDKTPFAANMAVAKCPWNEKHELVRIALKGRIVKEKDRPAMNLVFLLDVSGSMAQPNKLPLVKQGMTKLVRQLNSNDRIAIVVYAGASGLVLPSTVVDKEGTNTILDAIERLNPGGSTNGAQGIELAYAIAAKNFSKKSINRVILCTDGDFNVGITDQSQLTTLIEKKAKEDVFLTVLGFGCGNYKDSTLEKLADKGNGNYGYIDTPAEAEKLLVRQLTGTLVTIAKDVKIQVEFNPNQVAAYRLLGYENRVMAKEDFNNDQKDAGEIGAGHTVTAFYELIPASLDEPLDIGVPEVDELKYQAKEDKELKKVFESTDPANKEILTLKLRYKEPTGKKSTKVEFPLPVPEETPSFDKSDEDFRFAGSVIGFSMLLRDSKFKGTTNYEQLIDWAEDSQGDDEHGYRSEFVQLLRTARSLSGNK